MKLANWEVGDCVRLIRGDRLIEVKFTVSVGSDFREFDKWPLIIEGDYLTEGHLIEVWLYSQTSTNSHLSRMARIFLSRPCVNQYTLNLFLLKPP